MLKRPTPAIKWTIGLSVPVGLASFLPVASWVYAELCDYKFMVVVWLSGLQHGLQPDNLLLAGLAGGASAIGIPAFVAFALLPPKPLHGSARLARPGEIARAKLYKAGEHSILLGRHRGKLLAFNGDLHPFLAAATGTGKGVGFVVPNLLHQFRDQAGLGHRAGHQGGELQPDLGIPGQAARATGFSLRSAGGAGADPRLQCAGLRARQGPTGHRCADRGVDPSP